MATTASTLTPSSRVPLAAEVLKVLALTVAALGVMVVLRAGVPWLGTSGVLASATTTGTQLSVTDVDDAGVDGQRIRIALEVRNTGTEPLTVDAGWFRMMNGAHMVPVLEPAGVPATRIAPGSSATVDLQFTAPPAGAAPRLEVTETSGAVATLLLPPFGDAPEAPAGTGPEHSAHG